LYAVLVGPLRCGQEIEPGPDDLVTGSSGGRLDGSGPT
jgi:hypothetical protein